MKTILRLGVYDRPGVLDRIAGLIRRNGYNINSLNAGVFRGGTSQINIVLGDERADVSKIGKQLYDINFISEYRAFNYENAVIRELVLVRMKKADFDSAYYKGARILEENEQEISFELTGASRDLDRLLAPVQEKLLDFVRSGALALSREGGEAV